MNDAWILVDFEQAVMRLEEALVVPAGNDITKAGCIQYFEFCFELAWKSVKRIAGSLGLPDCLSPKGCLKQAFANNWIDSEESWLEMLDARNRMSHTYNSQEALAVYDSLRIFTPELRLLLERLKSAA